MSDTESGFSADERAAMKQRAEELRTTKGLKGAAKLAKEFEACVAAIDALGGGGGDEAGALLDARDGGRRGTVDGRLVVIAPHGLRDATSGEALADELRARTIEIYIRAEEIARRQGIILADTKFEFGRNASTGQITIGDEVLTSDSSRYWDAKLYADTSLPLKQRLSSFDKQIVRDWLSANWDKQREPPVLPAEVIERTRAKYAEALEKLAGISVD